MGVAIALGLAITILVTLVFVLTVAAIHGVRIAKTLLLVYLPQKLHWHKSSPGGNGR